jgi:aspartate/methionine/tyrosine aminotransferase
VRAVDLVGKALARWDGDDIVDLRIGEPCFEPPEELREAFRRAADGSFGYGPAAGLPALRELLAARARDEEGLAVESGGVVVTHGAKGGLTAVMAALLAPGDEVIYPVPGYPAYRGMAQRFGAIPVGVEEGNAGLGGWSDRVADRVSSRTRMVVVSSPSNPSGSVLPARDLERLARLCADAGIVFVLDEAYHHFRFAAASDAVSTVMDGNLIRLRSASKSWSVCGWRIGWALTSPSLARRIATAQAGLLNPPAMTPQVALQALPTVPASYLESARHEVETRLGVLREALEAAELRVAAPQGGFYLWVGAPSGTSGREFCETLAASHGVGLWPGEDFGVGSRVRVAAPVGPVWRQSVEIVGQRIKDLVRSRHGSL